jgi:hypothetical protein
MSFESPSMSKAIGIISGLCMVFWVAIGLPNFTGCGESREPTSVEVEQSCQQAEFRSYANALTPDVSHPVDRKVLRGFFHSS